VCQDDEVVTEIKPTPRGEKEEGRRKEEPKREGSRERRSEKPKDGRESRDVKESRDTRDTKDRLVLYSRQSSLLVPILLINTFSSKIIMVLLHRLFYTSLDLLVVITQFAPIQIQ